MNWVEILISFFAGFGLCLALVIWSVSGEQQRTFFEGYEGSNGNKK